jgi:DNA-binding XRE family transcriptional regulator
MLERTKKDNCVQVLAEGKSYLVPRSVLEKYRLEDDLIPVEQVFSDLDKKFTRPGSLLKGLRYQEKMTQVVFAKKINVTQVNLSKMENGRRAIGREIAKRIEKTFGINYRCFLE